MKNYYRELKSERRIFHVGPSGLEIIIEPDGSRGYPRLTSVERKELNIHLKIQNLLAKAVETGREYRELLDIPYKVGFNYEQVMKTYEDILNRKLKPLEARDELRDLERYHGLLWRG